MNTVQLIRKKRDGMRLTDSEINYMISAYSAGSIPDYQFSAFLMAAFLKGMDETETASLTRAMLYSGEVISLDSLNGIKIDKHSTGGVGDKTSLILAPIAAAAGIYVPMISGRGLGHTGGTLDKLEAIPGFRTDLKLDQFISCLQNTYAGLIGQTAEIAPADKKIYALRDVTGTVESIPLITASIMSKKLAEGINGLVLDIKTGSGAFMKSLDDARALAESLISTAKNFGKKVTGFITDMNQPLGHYIGNWLEVVEVINVLKGDKVNDLLECTLNLSGAMCQLAGKAETLEEGICMSEQLISSGKAYDKFLQIVRAQGGDVRYLDNPSLYTECECVEDVICGSDGYFSSINNYALGIAALELGAGRRTKEDIIDPAAGIVFMPKIGDRMKKGDVIARIYTNRKEKADEVRETIASITGITPEKPEKPVMIKEILK